MATGIGETLRAARRQQGVPLSDAAAETRVRESYLAALEEEDFSALGGDVYVKGFLRSYARFLRLDPEPLVAAYRAEHEQPADDIIPLGRPAVAPLNDSRRPGMVLGVGAVAAVLVLLAIVGIVNDDDPSQAEMEAAPRPVETEQPVPTEPVGTDPAETEQATEPAGTYDGVEVVLDLTDGESWMRVTVDGSVEFEGVQAAGTEVEYQGDEEVTIRLGNPGVVNVTVNGENLGFIGEDGVPTNATYRVDDTA